MIWCLGLTALEDLMTGKALIEALAEAFADFAGLAATSVFVVCLPLLGVATMTGRALPAGFFDDPAAGDFRDALLATMVPRSFRCSHPVARLPCQPFRPGAKRFASITLQWPCRQD